MITEFLPDFKVCTECKKKKPKEEFNLNTACSDGLHSKCKECNWIAHLHNHYCITEAQYKLMLKAQNDVCAICGQPETAKYKNKILSVDHCHKTHKIRGLLCQRCNSILGFVDDDPKRLEKAAQYLKHHSSSSI